LNTPLPYETAQYYAAQIVSSLEYLHNKGIAHRDLKPENIMLDEYLRIKIIDFATAKIRGKEFNKKLMIFEENSPNKAKKKRNTFVGTAEYVSPEVLKDGEVGPEADLWALGCIIYQMFTGHSPFKEKTEYLIFKKILEQKVNFPNNVPPIAVSLIKQLLNTEPKKRLGAGPKGSSNDYKHLKNHEFFNGIDFTQLDTMELPLKQELKLSPNFKESYSVLCNMKEEGKEEEVVKEGIVRKKSPWFHYNTRRLVLYNKPKIEYIDPCKNMVKGVIFLSKCSKAVLVNNNSFELQTPNRTFYFKTENNDAIEWVKVINQSINKIS